MIGKNGGTTSWVGSVAMAFLGALLLSACAPAEKPKVTGITGLITREAKPKQDRLTTWAESGKIRLTWEHRPDAEHYTVFWAETHEEAAKGGEAVEDLKQARYEHTGLKDGQTYYYRVVGYNKNGKAVGNYPVVGDVPFNYQVKRFPEFLAVMPRIHDTFDTLAGRYLRDPAKGWIIQEFNDLSYLEPFKAVMIPLKSYEPGSLTLEEYKTVPILTYHQISRTKSSRMSVQAPDFELQMAYLKRNRYQVITLEQFVDFLEFKGQVPDKAVVITFDDGWRSTYEIALPILQRYGYPATLFIYTDLIESNSKALTWNQVRALEKSGVIDVQCHTKSHRDLKMQPEEGMVEYFKNLVSEMKDSRELLKQKTRKTCTYLAYPYGSFNHLVAAMAEELGYRAAFTVRRGTNPFFVSNYRVLRSMVYGGFDIKQFAAELLTQDDKVLK